METRTTQCLYIFHFFDKKPFLGTNAMLLHFLALLPVLVSSEMTSTMDHVKNSGNGSFDGTFAFRIIEEVVGWEAVITFSTSVNGLTVCI